MSRILRRPMFRGGRVSSYGTGIASGLADGGMPPKRGLVTGPGGYQGDWNWKGGSSGNITTGKEVVDKAAKTLESRLAKGVRGAGRWLRNPGTGITGAIGRHFPTALRWGAHGLPVYGALKGSGAQLELIDKASEKGMLDEFGESIEFADGRILPSYEFAEKVEPSDYTIEGGLLETDEEKERKALQAMTSDKASKLDEKKKKTIGDLERERLLAEIEQLRKDAAGGESLDIDKETYLKLLGGDKAKGEDVTAMLLGFAGAEGDTVMEKFQKFAAAEAQRPGKREKLEETAGLLAIKDYMAGKRSKESLTQLLSQLNYKAKLSKASLGENIMKVAGPGSTPTVSNIKVGIKATFPGKVIEEVTSTESLEFEPSDEGKIFLETDTKTVYTIKDGVRKTLY
jgi:hypothetical protein